MTTFIDINDCEDNVTNLNKSLERLSLADTVEGVSDQPDWRQKFIDLKNEFISFITCYGKLWRSRKPSEYQATVLSMENMNRDEFFLFLEETGIKKACTMFDELHKLRCNDACIEIRPEIQAFLSELETVDDRTPSRDFFITIFNMVRNLREEYKVDALLSGYMPFKLYTSSFFHGTPIVEWGIMKKLLCIFKNFEKHHCSLKLLKGTVEDKIAKYEAVEILEMFLSRETGDGEKFLHQNIIFFITDGTSGATIERMIDLLAANGYSFEPHTVKGYARTFPLFLSTRSFHPGMFRKVLELTSIIESPGIRGNFQLAFGPQNTVYRTFGRPDYTSILPRQKTLLGHIVEKQDLETLRLFLDKALETGFKINTETNILSIICPTHFDEDVPLLREKLALLIERGLDMQFETFMGTPLQIARFYGQRKEYRNFERMIIDILAE